MKRFLSHTAAAGLLAWSLCGTPSANAYMGEEFIVGAMAGLSSYNQGLEARLGYGFSLAFRIDPEISVGFFLMTSSTSLGPVDMQITQFGLEGAYYIARWRKGLQGLYVGPRLLMSNTSAAFGKVVRESSDFGLGARAGYDFRMHKDSLWSIGPDVGYTLVFSDPEKYSAIHAMLAVRFYW